MRQSQYHYTVTFALKYFGLLVLQAPGYSTELKPEAVQQYEYPNGIEWQNMFHTGIFKEIKY